MKLSYYSITTDFWTSSSHNPYLSLIMHCIDREWNLGSVNLQTTPLFKHHTGVNIYEALSYILEHWNLEYGLCHHWQWVKLHSTFLQPRCITTVMLFF